MAPLNPPMILSAYRQTRSISVAIIIRLIKTVIVLNNYTIILPISFKDFQITNTNKQVAIQKGTIYNSVSQRGAYVVLGHFDTLGGHFRFFMVKISLFCRAFHVFS
jgi:hypothetical protein